VYERYLNVSVDRVGPLELEDASPLLIALRADLLLQEAEVLGRGPVESRVRTKFDVA